MTATNLILYLTTAFVTKRAKLNIFCCPNGWQSEKRNKNRIVLQPTPISYYPLFIYRHRISAESIADASVALALAQTMRTRDFESNSEWKIHIFKKGG